MSDLDIDKLDWEKEGGLLPAIVQDAETHRVLMLGYMDRAALEATLRTGRVTFYSRSRQRLWTKGETSGNFLHVVDVTADCDADALLVLAEPAGPTCHKGTVSCFSESARTGAEELAFPGELEGTIARRIEDRPEGSYTARLFGEGPGRIAQKLGEEGVELALAAAAQDRARVTAEAADLVYHLLLLLAMRELTLADVAAELEQRHRAA